MPLPYRWNLAAVWVAIVGQLAAAVYHAATGKYDLAMILTLSAVLQGGFIWGDVAGSHWVRAKRHRIIVDVAFFATAVAMVACFVRMLWP